MELNEARTIIVAAASAWASISIELMRSEMMNDTSKDARARLKIARQEEELRAEVLDACVLQYAKALAEYGREHGVKRIMIVDKEVRDHTPASEVLREALASAAQHEFGSKHNPVADLDAHRRDQSGEAS